MGTSTLSDFALLSINATHRAEQTMLALEDVAD